MIFCRALGAAAFTLALAAPLQAAPAQCETKIDGDPVTIFYDDEELPHASLRERYFTRSGTCPGAVVITYLMPDLTPAEREVFCANYDPNTGSHSMPAQGRRDAYGRCAEPSRTCTLVNDTRREALELMGIGKEAEDGTSSSRLSSTISAVTHASGAMILSGSASGLSGLLASAGTSIGTALGTPAVLAGAAASLVVVGGAVYLCSDDS